MVSGQPDVWIDGYIYPLKPYVAVGFPAGGGVAHCFVNNTSQDVQLLVLGERTKETCPIWWSDALNRPLDPHTGRPGPVQARELGGDWPSCVIDCTQLPMSKEWHYPGDSETFGEYARLTDHLGLKALGIGYEALAPGKRSTFPHAHKTEEEFVYILSGTATVWMNGFTYNARAGDGIGFLPATGIAHCLINNTDQTLLYMVVGEAKDETHEDRLLYPQHPFRNQQCIHKKTFWENHPSPLMGPHKGRPDAAIVEHLSLRHVLATDENLILEIFRGSSNYFRNVDGCEPTLKSVHQALEDGPKKKTEAYRKEFLLIEYRDQAIGVVDLHIHHPENNATYIGLLLLRESVWGQGLGRRAYAIIEHYLKTIFAIQTLKLGVSDDNDVSRYWKKMGFEQNGKTYSWQGENKTTSVKEFEKILA